MSSTPKDTRETTGKTATESTTVFEAPDAIGKRSSLWGDARRLLFKNPLFIVSAVMLSIIVLMAAFPQLFAMFNTATDCASTSDLTGSYCWRDPGYAELARSAKAPSAGHPFGFDVQGRDLFTRIMYGARNSVTIGLLTTTGIFIVAMTLGALAGYFGGIFDALVARTADIFFAIPTTLAGIAFLNLLPQRGVLEVSGVLIAFGWPAMMRIVRSSVVGEREREYVQAAKALGSGPGRILSRHILPNSIAPVVVYATLTVGVMIGAEATLSFLGVGLQLPTISWGLMVSEAQKRLLQAPHLLVFPGLFISMTVFSFILMGDALRDALDPRLR